MGTRKCRSIGDRSVGDREREGEMLGTGKESVWGWECVGKERVQIRFKRA
jgi:hypothetical protein